MLHPEAGNPQRFSCWCKPKRIAKIIFINKMKYRISPERGLKRESNINIVL
jgi:hypothetical protein